MNKIINPSRDSWAELLKRPTQTVQDIEGIVAEVFDAIQQNGDQAVAEYTQRFDGVILDTNIVSEEEFASAKACLSEDLQQAIQLAQGNIEKFFPVHQ